MFARFIRYYRDIPINAKMRIVLVPLLCLSILANLLISDLVYSRTISEQAKTNAQNELNILTVRINEIYNSVKTCSDMAIQDINSIYNAKSNSQEDPLSYITLRMQITSALSYDIRCFPYISSCIFWDNQGNLVQIGLKQDPDLQEIKDNFLTSAWKTASPHLMTFSVNQLSCLDASRSNPVWTLGKKIIKIQTGEKIGYILFNISSSTLSEGFPDKTDFQSFYLLDENGRIVAAQSGSASELLRTADPVVWKARPRSGQAAMVSCRIAGSDSLLLEQPVTSVNWVMVSQISFKSLYKPLYNNTLLTILLGILILLIASTLISLISKMISAPIEQLTESVLQVGSGHLHMNCKINSNDEIGTLSKNFTMMLVRIKDLLTQLKENEKRKQQYKLALLQSQMRPHFLYNSLDLIYVLSEMGYSQKAAVASKALADFYRTSLSGGSEIIPIREEVQNVENYLTIQHARFFDLFQYRLDISPEILDASVPKLTLQPLAENAIYHGLKGKAGGGYIVIKGRMEKNSILLKVEDNGVGMPKEKLDSLLQSNSKDGSNFGLQCVHERIRLYFGESYGLNIWSKPGVGTDVQVHLPKIHWEPNQNLLTTDDHSGYTTDRGDDPAQQQEGKAL